MRPNPEPLIHIQVAGDLHWHASSEPLVLPLSKREADIMEAVGEGTYSGLELANRVGVEPNGYFRSVLAGLVRRGVLQHEPQGYRRGALA